jgi:glycosyltransferase involved in cell wall biosynthesis
MDAFIFDMGWTVLSNPRYLLEAKLRGVATIGWSKGIPQDATRKVGRLKSIYQKSIVGLCDALVVYGHISRDFFLDLGYPAERIFIAQNTIDTAGIAEKVPQAKIDRAALVESLGVSGRFVFGYLGALIERKKVDQIIASFEIVRKAGLDAVLIIAGGGAHDAALKEVAKNSPFHQDIRFVGRVPVGGELAYFQLFDAYLSFAQGGLGILEAMAGGRLVISTPEKYPETEHLVDRETALISKDFSVESFAEAMAEAVANPLKNAVYGDNAQRRVLERATLEKMAASICQAVEYSIKSKMKSS